MVNFQLNIWSFFDQFSVEFNTISIHSDGIQQTRFLDALERLGSLVCTLILSPTAAEVIKTAHRLSKTVCKGRRMEPTEN